ncbi:fibronectin type III domain-containing protein [Candidatus Uhrbacteria bacterium]|nr:fibronectin type III domain-containing protein [Candidatus Uhrbacteria bacterium]
MKYAISILILGLLAGAGVLFYQTQNTGVDATGKVHTEIYEGAKKSFDGGMSTSLFREQEVDGEVFGSSTAFRIQWQAPEREYNHFVLTITDPLTEKSIAESGNHDRFALDITGLEPETEYHIVLQACISPRCEKWYVSETELIKSTGVERFGTNETSSEQVLLNP